MAKKDKPVKKPARETPVKGTRPGLNGGTLNSGGSWKNSGRPPSILRELARGGLFNALPNLERIATAGTESSVKDADQINAAAVLARIGLPSQVDVGENPENPLLTPEERLARAKALLGP